jgi:hypothetical protein
MLYGIDVVNFQLKGFADEATLFAEALHWDKNVDPDFEKNYVGYS